MSAIVLGLLSLSGLAGCDNAAATSRTRDGDPIAPGSDGGIPASDASIASGPDASHTEGDAAMPACDPGEPCNPIPIESFPFRHDGTTIDAPSRQISSYACAASTDESGPEVYYAVSLTERGVLSVMVDDVSGDEEDVDVHLLSGLDGADCLARGNEQLSRTLDAGMYYIVVDTWVDGDGDERAADYRLDVDFLPISGGACAMTDFDQEMFWSGCDASLGSQCIVDGGDVFLRMPATGPVVQEAHLVTVDDGFGDGWPSSFTDGIEAHYALSQMATGYVMTRDQPWAPAGEGGSEFGQGSTGRKIPVEDEAWYVNMYWRNRPPGGTRVIIMNPENGRAVVASAGYETGPGSNTAVGGVTEEIHHYLGTSHRDTLTIGFAVDGELPLGPIDCE